LDFGSAAADLRLTNETTIVLAPFYQTDFRDTARIGGVNAYWDLFDPNLHLGGYVSTTLEPNLGWFLQVRGELDVRKVSTPGLTNLTKSDYEWAGGTARLNLFFFPYATTVPEFIRNRFSFFATVSAFHDVNSGQNILEYTAALAYKELPTARVPSHWNMIGELTRIR
jgi:hypothetical protein